MDLISYGHGVVLSQDDIDSVCESIIKILKEKLPLDAQCVTVIGSILRYTAEEVSAREVKL